MYKKLKVEWLELCGFVSAMHAMRLPKGTYSNSFRNGSMSSISPEDVHLAGKLIRAGDDHAKCMRGVVAWIKLEMQVGFMIEFETYRLGVECLSTSSSMHNELRSLKGAELAAKKQADLEEKVYTRIVMISYQTLRRIYKARRSHKHPDWQIFCDFIEELPGFDSFIMPEKG